MKWLPNRNFRFASPFSLQENSSSSHLILQQLRNCNEFRSVSSIHCVILKSGIIADTFPANHLINGYVRLREISNARRVFEEMPEPNVVSWTSLIAGFVGAGRPRFALWMYSKLFETSVAPNDFTVSTVINACSILAELEIGKKIHAHAEVMGFGSNLVVCSSLVCMYGNCNDVDVARSVFNSMDYKNIVTWTSMIAACAQNGRGSEALQVFRNFNSGAGEERANDFMLTSVINASASLGKLAAGRASHGAVIRGGHEVNDVVTSSLVDMYAKCGCFDYSWKIFKRIRYPSVVPYTSMIVGAAKYGLGKLSIELFKEMIDRGVEPNDVTFVGVLHGCSHSGLVNEGLEFLNSMLEKYGVNPDAKHYTCVVDMYCRVGRLDEAYKLAKLIRVGTVEGALLWGTLLSASRLHGRVDIAVEASKRLIESKQQVAGAYVTMSNAYALAGEWENAHGMRSEMKRAGVVKDPGCSWIEIRESTFVFHAGDLSFGSGKEVLSKLKELEGKMKERGYLGGSVGLVFVEVEQEAKEEIVSLHSERLALGFGLITVPKGTTIRIMKNLRICNDCHEAFKVISGIVDRDLVVRDVNRFHHFKNGSCSCRDFW